MMQRRWQIAAFVVALTWLASLWLGEHNTQLVPTEHLLAAIASAILVPWLLWCWRKVLAILAGPFVLISAIEAWKYGAYEHTDAITDCLEHCENLQMQMSQYRAQHGHYPERLAELNIPLPGQVIFPPQILKYTRTEDGYELWITDALMSYRGSETLVFAAHK